MEFDFTREPGREKKGFLYIDEVEKPLISIITPFFNAGKWIEQTFWSVINQTFPWFEWILVDDGSTQKESVQLLKKLGEKDKRIKIFYTENQGVSKARNYAVTKMESEILVPLDADDLIVPTFLETIYWGLFFCKEGSFCYTDTIGFSGQEYTWKKTFDIERIKVNNFLTNCAGIRKKDFLEVGGYREEVKICHEDWILWLDLLAARKKPVHLGYYGFWYRRSEEGRLHSVQKSRDIKERKEGERITKETAEQIKENIQAMEFPVFSKTNEYRRPKKADFARKKKLEKKIGVLLLLPWLELGGADVFNLDLVKGLSSKFQISIMMTVPAKNIWRQKFEEFCDEIYELPSFLEVKNYPEFISYFIETREIKILFLSNSYYGYYLLPCLERWFPELAVMDYVHMEEWYWRNGGYARISGIMENYLDKTAVCNEHTRKVMIEQFGKKEKDIETIYIGVEEDYFKETAIEQEKLQVRKNVQIEKEKFLILFPCRIHEQKRPFLMLEIADKMHKEKIEAAFLVVGDGPELERLKKMTKEKDLEEVIYFAGKQAEIRPFYREANLTLICSIKEGLALTAYESCAMGTPVVSSDVGGQSELITQDTGWLIPLLQKEEEIAVKEYEEKEILLYVNAIKEAIEKRELYQKKKENSRHIIEEKFSKKKMLETMEKQWVSLICEEQIKERQKRRTEYLRNTGNEIEEFLTLYCEVDALENLYQNKYVADEREELKRIVNSKWGRRLLQLIFKLKINRLFR